MSIDTITVPDVHSPMPVFQLTDQIVFPHPELAEPSGLLAVGGDLSAQRLLAGYRLGIFPWYSEEDPILWWFTSPRLVLFPEELKVSRRLKRYLRNTNQSLTIDRNFEQVIIACAQSRIANSEDTWITKEMINAYTKLHDLGYAHSVECWEGSVLVGGLYGIAIDKVFFGESMFSRKKNSSKFALIHLVNFLLNNNYRLIDCQMTTAHLSSLGAREVSGKEFQSLLKHFIHSTTPDGVWSYDTSN
jgi:leucyl/phenylalanyl-tRNA---protein transferase